MFADIPLYNSILRHEAYTARKHSLKRGKFYAIEKNFITGQSKVGEPDVAVGKSTPEYLSSSGTCLVFP